MQHQSNIPQSWITQTDYGSNNITCSLLQVSRYSLALEQDVRYANDYARNLQDGLIKIVL